MRTLPAPPARRRLGGTLAAVVTAAGLAVTSGGGAASAATAPQFTTYAAPAGLATDAGEPSVGADWATGTVMFQAFTQTLRISGLDTGSPTWTDVSSPYTSVTNVDPILATDPTQGRTWAGGLEGGCSLLAMTDDDGASWTPTADNCALPGWDHPTIGAGPYAPGALVPSGYPDAVYYCAQSGLSPGPGWCARSDDGGLTFGPAVPPWTTQCGGLHGHVKVAPDGTVYVPNRDCGGQAGLAESTDNGLTWTVHTIPGSGTQDESDPSIGVGAGGRVYECYQGKDGHAYAATSADRGATWTGRQDLGTAFGLQNIQFPAAVAGDNDRAACAFLGTPTGGDDQQSSFNGVWHLYVATTYDGGATWSTVDVTPTDPVQRGCIWLGGGSSPCRNLLDFIDATVTKQGKVVVGYADGCIDACVTDPTQNTYSALGTVAYQSGGSPLFAAYDTTSTGTVSPTTATAPDAPQGLTAAPPRDKTKTGVQLSWSAPASSGSSPLEGYRVYRGTAPGAEASTPVATVPAGTTSYDDTGTTSGTTYSYVVTAYSADGESPPSNEATATAK